MSILEKQWISEAIALHANTVQAYDNLHFETSVDEGPQDNETLEKDKRKNGHINAAQNVMTSTQMFAASVNRLARRRPNEARRLLKEAGLPE